jgi:UDP-GlcNAc3NAcA epimerase
LVLPLHPRTRNKLSSELHRDLFSETEQSSRLAIVPPVSFLDMIQLEHHSRLIMTDSGGVQKESYFFNKPCIILRPETEWEEVLETGKARLTGADRQEIAKAFEELIATPTTDFPSIFGDGHAAEFICQKILDNSR